MTLIELYKKKYIYIFFNKGRYMYDTYTSLGEGQSSACHVTVMLIHTQPILSALSFLGCQILLTKNWRLLLLFSTQIRSNNKRRNISGYTRDGKKEKSKENSKFHS